MTQENSNANAGLEPLKVTCTASDCGNDLHCFKATRKLRASGKAGACRSCGAELVDWDRVHKQDAQDAGHTFAAMRAEFIRHHFWHVDIDEKAFLHALRKGRSAFDEAVPKRIRQSVGKAQPYRDGQQTPFTGNIIYYAQHATASCCRKCMEYWHDIPLGRPLTDEEVHYLATLALLFIDERLPDLPQEGQKLPRPHAVSLKATGGGE
jgi:hypothetical protein